MKQIAIVSGKGGTGKTTICASFVALASNKIVADCDVETPNLHLLLNQKVLLEHDFKGSKSAYLDAAKCTQCNKCLDVCRFGALDAAYIVNKLKCEGCGACVYVCPDQALTLREVVTGKTFISVTESAKFSHAMLNIGADGSGKLVTEVRKNAVIGAEDEDLVIIDGSPGIGCVVIASITGCDAILVVSEPTLSGKHDLARVLELAGHFGLKAYVCVNKFDLNPEITAEIQQYCLDQGIEVIGIIPYDPAVNLALSKGVPVVSIAQSDSAEVIKGIWEYLKASLS